MNKERFHNALAINLGYDRVVNDRSISIKIDDTTTDPVVTLTYDALNNSVNFNASEYTDVIYTKVQKSLVVAKEHDLKEIIEAVHQAYIEANTSNF